MTSKPSVFHILTAFSTKVSSSLTLLNSIPIFLTLMLLLTAHWDIAIEQFFYTPGEGFANPPFFQWMFTYGPFPGLFLSLGSLIVFLLSYGIHALKPWRRQALVLSLTMAVGSGLIVHALLKDHWGRPRPKQLEMFGGTQQFRPFYSPNFFQQTEPAKSLPCGHCSTGFYFFAAAILFQRTQKKAWLYGSLVLSMLLGGLLGFVRMAQGGHFLSDVLISALIMWLTAYFLARWIMKEPTP